MIQYTGANIYIYMCVCVYYHYYTNHLYYIIIETIFKKSRKFRLSSPVLYKIGLSSFGFTLQHRYTATQLYFKHSRVETLLMDRWVSRLPVSAPTMDMWNPDANSKRGWRSRPWIGFRSRFSQCVDYMRFNEKSFCFRWQETTKLMLFFNTKTFSLVVLCDLRYLTGNISSVMTKHMGVQRKLHRFAYLIVQIILWFYS